MDTQRDLKGLPLFLPPETVHRLNPAVYGEGTHVASLEAFRCRGAETFYFVQVRNPATGRWFRQDRQHPGYQYLDEAIFAALTWQKRHPEPVAVRHEPRTIWTAADGITDRLFYRGVSYYGLRDKPRDLDCTGVYDR